MSSTDCFVNLSQDRPHPALGLIKTLKCALLNDTSNCPMEENKTEEEVVKELNSNNKTPWIKPLIIIVVMAVLGVGSGLIIAKATQTELSTTSSVSKGSEISKGTKLGSSDTKTFKDTAEGMLKEGGVDGEGQYHLERPGGESQNVYLTSSVVDLSLLKGRKIKVWGQTFAAEKAGWLMDVGRVEVLDD